MGTTYVEVPSDDIINTLEGAGFSRVQGLTTPGGRPLKELVYERAHEKDSAVKVRVYTSISTGYSTARKRAKDSIKVCTVVVGRRTFGIGKFPRVHRTGSTEKVLARMLQRMRAAYERGTEWIREKTIKDVMLA